ncbi:hypothetical protein HQ40_07930 [Porphyromonas gulae]|uniref:hypothetical protein n=1 Tax=Porphyromonas gulae TaxID=111105 RepID=UPI00052E24DE|nr:hypothetical protein [Porphyromonas gulae]KGN73942.1 hypothetical protein HQ40_07930 [Porphyromonas gulae]
MTSKKVENIKENTMTTLTHDLTRHLRALRQTLSQDKKPIGFFISAGCPLSVPMPEGEWPLIPDMKQLSEYVSSQLQSKLPNTPSVFDRLIKELESTGKDKNNLEDALSFVRSLKSVACGGGMCTPVASMAVFIENSIFADGSINNSNRKKDE